MVGVSDLDPDAESYELIGQVSPSVDNDGSKPRSIALAEGGIRTTWDIQNVTAALTADVLNGRVTLKEARSINRALKEKLAAAKRTAKKARS